MASFCCKKCCSRQKKRFLKFIRNNTPTVCFERAFFSFVNPRGNLRTCGGGNLSGSLGGPSSGQKKSARFQKSKIIVLLEKWMVVKRSKERALAATPEDQKKTKTKIQSARRRRHKNIIIFTYYIYKRSTSAIYIYISKRNEKE